jgi:hypothetical protein
MPTSTLARACFGVTALVVLVGLAIQLPVAMDNTEGFFDTPAKRGLNMFTFFTVQSNILVGVSTALLALDRARPTTAFRTLRLTALVGITLTFIVFHLALRELQDLTGQAAVADFLLHTASPLLCVGGWLLFGPRGQTSRSTVLLSLVFLVAWGTFTLVRGEIVGWYPYPFMEPFEHGYLRVALNLVLVGAIFVGLSAGAHWLDGRLSRRRG